MVLLPQNKQKEIQNLIILDRWRLLAVFLFARKGGK